MLAVYQETVRSILDQSDHPGVSAEELELFKSQFRTSAYTCRLKSCPRATLGFETEKSRLEHELAHVRRFRCTFPACHFPPFASAQALKGHVNKYHDTNPAPKSIRNIQTPSASSRAPTRHDEEGDKPMQKRRKKSSLMLSASSNATQPEKNEQALNKRANRSLPRLGFSILPIGRSLNSRRPVATLNILDEATEQTMNPSPVTRQDSLVLPWLKRSFSPEPWQSSYQTPQSETFQNTFRNITNSFTVGPPKAPMSIPNGPMIPQMESRIDKMDFKRVKSAQLKLTGHRSPRIKSMLGHRDMQGAQQTIEWDHEPVKSSELNFTDHRSPSIKSMLDHFDMQDAQQKIAGVPSLQSTNVAEHPASPSMVDASPPSSYKTSSDLEDEQLRMAMAFDAALGRGAVRDAGRYAGRYANDLVALLRQA